MILIDTDVLIDIWRGHPSAVAWIQTNQNEAISISGFTALEMIQGCQNKNQQRAVGKILALCRIEWLSQQNCEEALNLFSQYYLSHSLGMIDALIGQTALSLNVPLCTFNRKHYRMIKGLQLIQPYQR